MSILEILARQLASPTTDFLAIAEYLDVELNMRRVRR
jgi:hypothetical protein